MKIETITNAVYADAKGETINCTVKFKELAEPVPFSARADDAEAHGRAVHAAILAGEAGDIGAYVPPPTATVALRTINQLERDNPITHRALREFFIGFGASFADFQQTLLYQRAKAVDDAIKSERTKL